MKKPNDYGTRSTDEQVERYALQIKAIYTEAEKDIENKYIDFLKKSTANITKWQSDVAAGKITQDEMQEKLLGQAFQSKRWQSRLDSITQTLTDADKKAASMMHNTMIDVFRENSIWTSYNIEKDFNGGISFDIYDSKTIERLIKNDPKMLPEWKINEKKDYIWNQKRVQNAIAQGIIQGESLKDMGKRLARDISSTNNKKMVMFARTAATGAQNAGRIDAMHKAEQMGIKVEKTWIATLDSRTRDAHKHLDGQTVKVDDAFDSQLGAIQYPGDPDADPRNVYNCRCSLGWEYPDYKNQYTTRAAQDENGKNTQVKDMSYKDWEKWVENGRPEIKEEPKQEETKKKEPELSQVIKRFMDSCEKRQIEYHEVQPLDTDWANDTGTWAESEIVERLHGGDLTTGSCASLALAYAGNRCGYDVIDYRGGNSQEWFSRNSNLRYLFNLPGVECVTEQDTNDMKACKRLFEKMQDNKEYILSTGQHASIIRKKDGTLQYLELQSANNSGWHDFEKNTLRWRFGCKQSHSSYGMKFETSNELVNVESFKNVNGFDKILGYINTPVNEQKKGTRGHEK